MDFPINLAVSLEKSFPKQPAEKLECHATPRKTAAKCQASFVGTSHATLGLGHPKSTPGVDGKSSTQIRAPEWLFRDTLGPWRLNNLYPFFFKGLMVLS